MSPAEAYLAELSGRLRRRLPSDVAEARLRELRAHLTAAAQEVGESEALRRFGSPAALVRSLVRQHRGYDRRGALSLTIGLGPLFLLGLLVPSIVGRWGVGEPRLSLAAMLWIPFVGVVLLGARALQTRRWLALSAAAWAAAGFGLANLTTMGLASRSTLPQEDTRIASIERSLGDMNRTMSAVAAWRSGRAPADSAPAAGKGRSFTYVPGIPAILDQGEEAHYYLRRGGVTPEQARAAWAAHGEDLAQQTAEMRDRAQLALDMLRRRSFVDGAMLTISLRMGVVAGSKLLLVLAVANGIALLLGWLVDRLPAARRSIGARAS